MTYPAFDPPLTPRERLRWRRAMDALLIDEIFTRVVRDARTTTLALQLPWQVDASFAASSAKAPAR